MSGMGRRERSPLHSTQGYSPLVSLPPLPHPTIPPPSHPYLQLGGSELSGIQHKINVWQFPQQSEPVPAPLLSGR